MNHKTGHAEHQYMLGGGTSYYNCQDQIVFIIKLQLLLYNSRFGSSENSVNERLHDINSKFTKLSRMDEN